MFKEKSWIKANSYVNKIAVTFKPMSFEIQNLQTKYSFNLFYDTRLKL